VTTRGRFGVVDLAYVALTIAAFGLLAVILRGVERL